MQDRFNPAGLEDLRSEIRSRSIKVLDALPVGVEFDWVERVSIELTAKMLTVLLDVPEADRLRLIAWSDAVSNADNPEVAANSSAYYDAVHDAAEYFLRIREERRREPPGRQDLISLLAHGAHTRDMSMREFVGNIIMLMVGGNDTTRNSISGSVLAMNRFPDQFELLRSNPAYLDSFAPELIRWQCPLTCMRRNATQDFEYKGHRIRKGDMVILWYYSANHDTAAIDRPEQFIVNRERPHRHLSFGFGIHSCIGRHLAEMQIKVFFEELLSRDWGIDIVGEAVQPSSLMFRTYSRLPVRLSAVAGP